MIFRIFLALAFLGLFPFFFIIGFCEICAGYGMENAIVGFYYVLKDILKIRERRY